MDRDIQNMGRASRGEGRREGEGNTNGHSSGAGHEKESRTSQWTVIAGGRGEGARREGVHRPPGARCRMEPGGRGPRGRRPDPQVAAEERPREGSRERGEGGNRNTRGRRKKGGKGEGEREQAGRQRQHTHAHPRWKSKYINEAKDGQRGLRGRLASGCAEEVGELGEARYDRRPPKKQGGPIRLPASPLGPPLPPRSRRVPSSRELRPVPGGRRRRRPRGELGGGGGSARAAARGKLRRGAAGLAPPPSRAPRPGAGRGRSERSLASEEAASTGGEAAGAGRGEGGGGGGTSQLPPRASLARQPGAPLPRRRSEPCPQRQSLNESETRGCRRRGGAGSGLAPGEGGRQRAEAAGGTEKWLELGGCGSGGCNFAENTGRDADAAGAGRDQVAVEISSGGERAFGAKCGCERSARGITVPGTAAERPGAGRPRGRRERAGREKARGGRGAARRRKERFLTRRAAIARTPPREPEGAGGGPGLGGRPAGTCWRGEPGRSAGGAVRGRGESLRRGTVSASRQQLSTPPPPTPPPPHTHAPGSACRLLPPPVSPAAPLLHT